MKLDGKVVVVTGGGDGIGRHLVFDLLRRGATAVAVDIRQESLDQTAGMVRTGALGPLAPGVEDRLGLLVGDVTDREACKAMPGRVIESFSAVDGLINNAGIMTVVMPGGVATDITTNSGVESPMSEAEAANSLLPTTTPADAATVILDGVEDDKLHVYVGVDSKIMNVGSRLAPKRATYLITKQMKSLLD